MIQSSANSSPNSLNISFQELDGNFEVESYLCSGESSKKIYRKKSRFRDELQLKNTKKITKNPEQTKEFDDQSFVSDFQMPKRIKSAKSTKKREKVSESQVKINRWCILILILGISMVLLSFYFLLTEVQRGKSLQPLSKQSLRIDLEKIQFEQKMEYQDLNFISGIIEQDQNVRNSIKKRGNIISPDNKFQDTQHHLQISLNVNGLIAQNNKQIITNNEDSTKITNEQKTNFSKISQNKIKGRNKKIEQKSIVIQNTSKVQANQIYKIERKQVSNKQSPRMMDEFRLKINQEEQQKTNKFEYQIAVKAVEDQQNLEIKVQKQKEEEEESQKQKEQQLKEKAIQKAKEAINLRIRDRLSKVTPQPMSNAGISTQQAVMFNKYTDMFLYPFDSNEPMMIEEYEYFEKKYHIGAYPEIPICVVIPSYNNVEKDRYKDNLNSVLQQNYSNYHVVFIDDVSEDRTGQFVKKYVDQIQLKEDKIKIIINKEKKYTMQNLRHAAFNECKEEQLFMIIDGDDMLIGRQVFKFFSAVMQQKDLWVMYSNFITPRGEIGYSRQYTQMNEERFNYRHTGFYFSHLRAYYTKLFRLIKQEDLKNDRGEYFKAANDVAIGIPVMEMANKRVEYIPEISYYYNDNTGYNNHIVRLHEQKQNEMMVRRKTSYAPLLNLFNSTKI